jgi:hypothetical protein
MVVGCDEIVFGFAKGDAGSARRNFSCQLYGPSHPMSVRMVRYIEAVERLDPTIVRDAIAELNRNEYALGRISDRYH